MVRSILVSLCAVFLALASASAEERKSAKTKAAQAEEIRKERGLESIADEVNEVSEEGTEQDGMSRTMDELLEAEDQDGCSGEMAAANYACGGG
ncbi:MAG: hypothetical protein AAGB11_15210 [Pseudomonadota bacterium]